MKIYHNECPYCGQNFGERTATGAWDHQYPCASVCGMCGAISIEVSENEHRVTTRAEIMRLRKTYPTPDDLPSVVKLMHDRAVADKWG